MEKKEDLDEDLEVSPRATRDDVVEREDGVEEDEEDVDAEAGEGA